MKKTIIFAIAIAFSGATHAQTRARIEGPLDFSNPHIDGPLSVRSHRPVDSSPYSDGNSIYSDENSRYNDNNSPYNDRNSRYNANSDRAVYDNNGNRIGYAVPKANGGVNVFDNDGNRIGYSSGRR